MGIGAGLYMYDVVVKTFKFAILSTDEFLFCNAIYCILTWTKVTKSCGTIWKL